MSASKARAVLDACNGLGLMITTAESCTGGMVAAAFTSIPGSSSAFDCGFLTYSDNSKHLMLDVSKTLIAKHGVVSEAVALAMAEGALVKSDAHVSVSVTGVAGPTGATGTNPVGLVHIASARIGRRSIHRRFEFSGDRASVREQSVTAALDMILKILAQDL